MWRKCISHRRVTKGGGGADNLQIYVTSFVNAPFVRRTKNVLDVGDHLKKKSSGLSLSMTRPQIFNRGRNSFCNINQQLTICQQMLKIWCTYLFLFCNVMNKIGAFTLYFCHYICGPDTTHSYRYLCLDIMRLVLLSRKKMSDLINRCLF